MTGTIHRVLRMGESGHADGKRLVTREWLLTNGIGGYASGTLGGVNTRHYHGLLTAAQPAPLGRVPMLRHLTEELRLEGGESVRISGECTAHGEPRVPAADFLVDFQLENGLPVWRYRLGEIEYERRIVMPYGQNTTYLIYRLTAAPGAVILMLRPAVQSRRHDEPSRPNVVEHILTARGDRYEIAGDPTVPVLRLRLLADRQMLILDGGTRQEIHLQEEAERGYDPRGALWSPGRFEIQLAQSDEAALIASTEPWASIDALHPGDALALEVQRREQLLQRASSAVADTFAGEMVLAADQFLITPPGRIRERIRAQARGDEVKAVIAGYHWFTDWGRDTLISLEGLTLVTGRTSEARWILRSLSQYLRDGLVPNLFPEGEDEGLYHTADATLWFFHALDRYLAYTDDRVTLRLLLPKLIDIAEHHLHGTRFGIEVDGSDGLLRQGQEGYQLTWMDAKVDDWVVTPRRGKAVEINALWYNALSLLAGWLAQEDGDAATRPWRDQISLVRESFNRRFWYARGGYLYDVVDGESGDDAACRPNQLFSFALPNPVLERKRWKSVLDVVRQRLLVPLGLRTLSPDHPDFKSRYFGDLRDRDAAYHQGTVWPWLIGPFIDAWLAANPDDRAGARGCLQGFPAHLDQACIGSISEICDAQDPFTARGCIAQAWSVAEVLRSWVKTAHSPQSTSDGSPG